MTDANEYLASIEFREDDFQLKNSELVKRKLKR